MRKIFVTFIVSFVMFGAAYADEVKAEAAKVVESAKAQKVKMKIKAKIKGDVVKAKVGIKHNMLTYDQAKKKGKEANFITHITATVGDKVVYDASTSQFLSKNPLIKFEFKSNGIKKGDMLKITYTQLKGEVFYDEKKIK
jgi:sulfur-oxidizing protein SoxZ